MFKNSSKTDGKGMGAKYQIITKFQKRKQTLREQKDICVLQYLLNGRTYWQKAIQSSVHGVTLGRLLDLVLLHITYT